VIADNIAAALGGSEAEPIEVPASGGVRVPRRSLVFSEGDPAALPADTGLSYRRKKVVDVGGSSLFAELAVARLFRFARWSAYWRDGYRGGWVADFDPVLRHHADIGSYRGPPEGGPLPQSLKHLCYGVSSPAQT
jgi:hypothetical protein